MKADALHERVCPTCGTKFMMRSLNHLFCSKVCKRAKEKGDRAGTPETRTCKQCGGQFSCSPTLLKIYCSEKCRHDFNHGVPRVAPVVDLLPALGEINSWIAMSYARAA